MRDNRSICSRQGGAEEVTILPDGSIPQVELTSCGLNGGPLKAEGKGKLDILDFSFTV